MQFEEVHQSQYRIVFGARGYNVFGARGYNFFGGRQHPCGPRFERASGR